MSKDQTRNIETFKVGGVRLDKFGLSRQQRKTAAQVQRRSPQTGGANRPLTKAEQVAKVTSAARRKAQRRNRNDSSSG